MDDKRKKKRLRLLYGAAHRYRRYRYILDPLVAIFFVLAPPLFGWLKFDLWSGRNILWGEEKSFVEVFKNFVVPFFAINAIILIVTHQLGRYLCGWVCPTGVFSRWAEELEYRLQGRPLTYYSALAVLSITVAFGGPLWWVDLRVFTEGSALAVSLTILGWLLLAVAIFIEVAWWRLGFCKSACPSGVYFAVLGQRSQTGVRMVETETEKCNNCKSCVDVCPVDLDPRDLLAAPKKAPGIYFSHMSSLSRCLRCGDCITACDFVFNKRSEQGVLHLGFDEAFSEPPHKEVNPRMWAELHCDALEKLEV